MTNIEKIKNSYSTERWIRYVTSDVVYLFLFILITFDKILATTMIGSHYPPAFKMGLRLMLLLFVLLKIWNDRKDTRYEWVLSVSIIIMSVLIWRRTGYVEMVESALLMLGAKKVDFYKILKVYLWVAIPILVGTVILSQLGIVENLIYHRGQITRIAFGFVYPTDFAAHIFFMVIVWCVLRQDALRYVELGIIAVLAVLLDVFCDARMNVICLFLTTLSFFILKRWDKVKESLQKRKIENYISGIIIAGIVVCIFIMVIFSYLYHPESAFWKTINVILTERLQYGKRGFEEFGVTLFGQRLPILGMGGTTEIIEDYFFLDSSYVRIFLEYGVVLFIAVFVLFIVTAFRLRSNRQYYVLVALALISIQCTIEHHLLEIAYNPFIFMFFADYAPKQKKDGLSTKMRKIVINDNFVKGKHAGTKARGDISQILEEWERFYLYDKDQSLPLKILSIVNQNMKLLLETGSNVVTLTQYPLYLLRFSMWRIPILNKKSKNIVLIHDMNSVRYQTDIKREIKDLNRYDLIISHNSCMSDYLRKAGIKKPVIELEIFDYLCSEYLGKIDYTKHQKNKPVIVAGNLDKSKSGYVYCLPENVEFNLYGLNYICENEQTGVYYKGAYQPEELVAVMEGSFGLVWDGDSIRGCDPYLSINNSHKTSLYFAAGIPVIIWKKDALAEFVEKNKCGILVDNLDEISSKIDNMSEAEYQEMKKNTRKISEKIVQGFYTKKAVNNALETLLV